MFNVKDLKKMDKHDLLNLIGLETRREASEWILPTLGAFTVGLLVGAGVGLLLAPKPGSELRDDLKNRLHNGANELQSRASGSAPGGSLRPDLASRGV